MTYDFILFEHLYAVQNHYKDLTNLVVLLKAAGYRVAIADAFKEAILCKVEGVPHINISIKCPKEFKEPSTYLPKRSALKKLYYRIRKDFYMYKVVKYLNSMTDNMYVGSMTLDTPVFFMRAFSPNKTYYIWALRSSHVLPWKKKIRNFSSLVSMMLYNNMKKHHNLRLLVSNKLIQTEFIEKAGVKIDRLILRPERFISTIKRPATRCQKENKTLHLLFIGTLRPFKNVEFCLKALNKLNDENIYYTIAGRCKKRCDENYNQFVKELAEKTKNVSRIDRYIPEEEYLMLIEDCDFLILCDKTQESCASNGTMSEALLSGKPIIAPDFNPFKYEIENYGVGYLYRYNDLDSLCDILIKAREEGVEHFTDNLYNYQKMFMMDEVARNLKAQIERN